MLDRNIRREGLALGAATLFSLALGLVSAILSSAIGPALQTVNAPSDMVLQVVDLLGPKLAEVVKNLANIESISVGQLWTNLPYQILALAGFRLVFSICQWYLWEKTTERIAFREREALVNGYLGMTPHHIYQLDGVSPRLSSTITTDVKLYREYLVHFYGGLPRELIQACFYFVTAYFLSPTLFIVFILGLTPAGIVLSKLGKKIRRRFGKSLESYAELSEWLQQRLLGTETIKQFGTESVELENLRKKTEDLNRTYLKTIRAKSRTGPLLEIIAVFVLVFVMFLALKMLASGEVGGSVMMSFFAVLAMAVQSASKLGRYYNSNKEGQAALERLRSAQEELGRFKDKGRVISHSDELLDNLILRLIDVAVKYPGSDTQKALNSVSLDFFRGRFYCVAGPSGSGKTTLMLAVLGLVPLDAGRLVAKEGFDAKDIGYLPQKPNLISKSIAENVAYPNSDLDLQRVRWSLEQCALLSEVENRLTVQPDGNGLALSGGQQQRLMLARLFYHNYSFIVMDEGTSAVDPENERLIYEALKLLVKKGGTILMVAHRPEAIAQADEVIYLDAGQLTSIKSSEP
ncbi:MAG: ABC transporter ATP-binding protein [Pseudobacteriovorax sp.]|nr:ABC transporter ATP-binding protein [Pseudobacteriovorax sp.]